MIKECKKESLEYRLPAIESTAQILNEWKIDRFEEMKPLLMILLHKVIL